MGKLYKISTIVIAVLFITIIFTNLADGTETIRNKNLDQDEHDQYYLWQSKGREVDVNFLVVDGSPADVYIMSRDEYNEHYNHYSGSKDFNASFQMENVTTVDATWTQPDDQTYYLIIDNENNAHSNDAKPEGNIRYDLEYDNSIIDEEGIEVLAWGCIGCFVGIVILVIIVIIIMVRKKPQQTVIIQGTPTYQAPPMYQQIPPPQYPPPQYGAPPVQYSYPQDYRKPPNEPGY